MSTVKLGILNCQLFVSSVDSLNCYTVVLLFQLLWILLYCFLLITPEPTKPINTLQIKSVEK